MRKYISKFGLIFLMAFVIGIGYGVSAKAADDGGVIGTSNLNGTAENSAKVGQQLKQPEKGWKRFDDNVSFIKKNGAWNSIAFANAYNTTYTYSTMVGNNIEFYFSGTKIRFIGRTHSVSYTANATIQIDGVKIGSFSQQGNDVDMIINFQKTGLNNGIHKVIITNETPSLLGFDAIDIDDDGKLLTDDCTTLIAKVDTNKQTIKLDWTEVNVATAYNVKRSTTQGNEYETIASNVKETTYVDENVQVGKTYYYIVTPIISGKEGTRSNEASAIIEKNTEPTKPDTKPEVKGDAVLFITMTNGNIKSYNVSMKTVNKFIEWYEDRASGSNGNSYFKFDKTRNEDEPKTEYIVFDKISSFQVEQNK